MLKHGHAKIDQEGKAHSLHFLQTKERQEVDFALVHNDKAEKMIEVKNANHHINPGLFYFQKRYAIPGYQVVKNLKKEKMEQGIRVVSGLNFLSSLDL